jgi:hypothetical protein
MTDDLYTDRLSDYLDGELEPREHATVEQHLAKCGACRATLGELQAVVARAGSLEDRAPQADLWPGIAPRLEPHTSLPGTIRAFRETARRRFSFTLPQLAAAGLALMVLSGGMVWMAQSGDPRADFPLVSAEVDPGSAAFQLAPANFSDASYDQAVADLERIVEEGRARLDPETIRVLEDNLRAIDQAIDQSRRALADDPANTYLNRHLAGTRQRKLALLRRASGFAAAGS